VTTLGKDCPMGWFILTATPGSGKTAVLRLLEQRGYRVVEEAATDVIALMRARGINNEVTTPSFIDDVLDLQQRERRAQGHGDAEQFFDRSPICTLALSIHLGRTPTRMLSQEVDRVQSQRPYDGRVLFVRNLGFVELTAATQFKKRDQ